MLTLVNRLQVVLRAVLVVLALGLAAAITLGILLAPPPAVGYAGVDGASLLRRSGTGPTAGDAAVHFGQHAIGIGVRCNGTGTIRVDLAAFGSVEAPCRDRDTSDGGFVLSDTPASATTWRVATGPGNRWSLVLTQPVDGGQGSLSP